MSGVQQTLIQQPDFTGIGGHELQNHGGHGLHTQVNIGMVGQPQPITFRELP
jgi:hypothetical protein